MWVDGTGWERLKEGFQLYLKKKNTGKIYNFFSLKFFAE